MQKITKSLKTLNKEKKSNPQQRTESKRQQMLELMNKPRDIKKEYYEKGIDTIGYFDIETSHLKGNFGIMLSWACCIRDVQNGKITIEYDFIDRNDVMWGMKHRNPDIDRPIIKTALQSISQCQLLVGHYFNGPKKMDMPFLRTRAAICGLEMPKYLKYRFMDTWGRGRALYSLTSNRLGMFGDIFGIEEEKTPVDFHTWRLAHWGDRQAMKYIVDHNIRDVELTHKVHKAMENQLPIPNSYI